MKGCVGCVVVFVLFCNTSVVVTDSCTFYSTKPTDHTTSFGLCNDFVYNTIFVPTNYTQLDLDKNIFSAVRLALFMTNKECVNKFLNLICRTGFRECGRINPILPSPPCKSQCMEVLEACKEDFATLNATGGDAQAFVQGFSCFVNDSFNPGQEMWPNSTVYYDVYGQRIGVQCSNLSVPSTYQLPATSVSSCPKLFAHNDDKYKNHNNNDVPYCEPACPIGFITKEERDFRDNMINITAGISLAFLVAFLAIYLLYPLGRKYPARFKLNVMFCAVGLSIAQLINVAGSEKTLCHDDTTLASVHDPLCGSQAIFLIYFGIAASLWWAIIPLHLFLALWDIKKSKLRVSEIYFQVIGWGLPIVFVIIAVASGHIGGYPGAELCLISDAEKYAWQWGVFYVPICLNIALGFIFFCASLYILISAEKQSKGNVYFAKYRTLLGFCWLGISIYSVVLADRFYNHSLIDETTDSVTAWLQCYVTAFTKGADEVQSCGDKPSVRPLLGMDNLFYFTLAIIGVILVAQHLTEMRFMIWFRRVFTKIIHREFHLADLSDVSDLVTTTSQSKNSAAVDTNANTLRVTSLYDHHNSGGNSYTASSLGDTSSVLGTSSNMSLTSKSGINYY